MTAPTTEARRTARQLAQAASAEAPRDVDPTACAAHGCPLRGTIDLGGSGRYLCHGHAMVTMDRWPAVTDGIRQHDWMLRIIRDIRAAGSRDTQWRKAAMLAWTEADMAPHADETQALYVARLLQDFEYRIGARANKPAPMVRQRTWQQFQPTHATAASVTGATALGDVL